MFALAFQVMDEREIIWRNLATFLKQSGYTHDEAATLADISTDSLKSYLAERRVPDRDRLIRLARLFDRPVDDFLNPSPPPPKDDKPKWRTKVVGEPPPGYQEELDALNRKYTKEKLDRHTQEKAKLRAGKKK